MTNEVETIKLGGVQYERSDLKAHSYTTKTRTNASGIFEEYKEYTVALKDGTVLRYEAQDESRQAAVDLDGDKVKFFGLYKANITDTYKNDVYELMGCEFTSVNADRKQSGCSSHKSADWDSIKTNNRTLSDGTVQYSNENTVSISRGGDTADLVSETDKQVRR